MKRRCEYCEFWHLAGIVCSDTGAYSDLVEEVFKEELSIDPPPSPVDMWDY